MDMTPQQIDELLDRIRDERGDAIDPARITDLLEADDEADRRADLETIARIDYDEANAAADLAEQAAAHAEHVLAEKSEQARIASESVISMRKDLGLVRTADGYKTIAQARADAYAAHISGIPVS